MMDQKEEMKKNLLEELDDYFMQLVYLKLVDCLEKCLICRHIRRFAD